MRRYGPGPGRPGRAGRGRRTRRLPAEGHRWTSCGSRGRRAARNRRRSGRRSAPFRTSGILPPDGADQLVEHGDVREVGGELHQLSRAPPARGVGEYARVVYGLDLPGGPRVSCTQSDCNCPLATRRCVRNPGPASGSAFGPTLMSCGSGPASTANCEPGTQDLAWLEADRYPVERPTEPGTGSPGPALRTRAGLRSTTALPSRSSPMSRPTTTHAVPRGPRRPGRCHRPARPPAATTPHRHPRPPTRQQPSGRRTCAISPANAGTGASITIASGSAIDMQLGVRVGAGTFDDGRSTCEDILNAIYMTSTTTSGRRSARQRARHDGPYSQGSVDFLTALACIQAGGRPRPVPGSASASPPPPAARAAATSPRRS
ncbi:hypothetical protein SMICM304S_02952 [Streptomyces microflavus]